MAATAEGGKPGSMLRSSSSRACRCAAACAACTLVIAAGACAVGRSNADLCQSWGEGHGQHHHDDEQPVELVRQHLELRSQAEQHKGELSALAQQEGCANALLPAVAAGC